VKGYLIHGGLLAGGSGGAFSPVSNLRILSAISFNVSGDAAVDGLGPIGGPGGFSIINAFIILSISSGVPGVGGGVLGGTPAPGAGPPDGGVGLGVGGMGPGGGGDGPGGVAVGVVGVVGPGYS
jgi:hypothetical protein